MVRSGYYTNPSEKKLETFNDFTGGLNTVTTNDNLSDTELVYLENADLDSRGNISRRLGMQTHLTPPVTGFGQGYFRYYKTDGTFEEITAVNGRLYKAGVELAITGLASGFQTTRKIEAVQFQSSLYIATGTNLVEYDGTTAKVIVPYKPVGQEALYVGFNGLYPDPVNYASDTTDVFNSIDTVIFDKRYGVINQKITTTIIVTKISADTLEYKTEVALPSSPTTFTTVQDWALAATGKTVNYTPTTVGDYAFRFTIRKQGTTGQDIVYNVPKYTVNQTDQNTTLSVATMQTCNRIFVHNDRLCLYGDTTYGNQLYFSHLNKPRYFPVNNTIDFKSNRQEGLTAVVKFRNLLVAFTPSNIQALSGTSPQDFVKKVINSSVGCVAPYSAVVVENFIHFVSKEGIFALVSTGTVDDRMNVRRLDEKIWNVLPQSTDCVGAYFNKQYHLVYPTDKVRFRYYTQMGTWTKDTSTKMTLNHLSEWNGLLYGQRSDVGDMVKFDPKASSVVTDLGEVYKFILESKYFDFGQPYHVKVLKQMQILMKVQGVSSDLKVYVSADSNVVINPDKQEIAIINGSVQWVTTTAPNVSIDAGTVLGSWTMGESAFGTLDSAVSKVKLSGKCRRTKIRIVHEENVPCSFLGVAYIFKLRKPK
jgi:hypothetical protein